MFNSLSKFQGSKNKKKGNIWQLFRATDFESLMYPSFTICRILALFPYQINGLNIKIFKPFYVLSTIITCVNCVCTLIIFYILNFSKDDESYYTNLPISRQLKENCYLICGCLTAVATFILSKPRMHLFQTIMQLSSKLSSETYQNLSRLIHAKDISFLVCLFVEVLIFLYHVGDLLTTFLVYNTMIVFHMDLLYTNCVFVLDACFKQVNDNLMNLVAPVTNDESHNLRRTYYNERNPLMELKALKKQHLAISNTVRKLNMIFSLQLLVTTIRTFSEITFLLFFFVMRWKIGMTVNNVNEHIYNMFLILAMTCSAIKTGLVIWSCETGKNQAADIKTTIHSVLNSTRDIQIKRELQLFSLQLMHHKNVFSTKWFNIDVTLLTAVSDRTFAFSLCM
ncbi:putative gustatory receptor 28b [Solenopsis invicta]|uniref:putative gustatory receptor 28b n=1 Tax=Solenopsis invicta TaxID=13686 RepID=UPI00193E5764|nr:putative gustatory receptor 28b [Solenopsis invicta]